MPTTSNVPKKLGRYQILKHLASGGMAEVLLARADGIEGFERYVVIKRIRSEQARDPLFIKMFVDEARLAARLHHQNIIPVHDIGEDQGEYFFTMEYLHGEDLRRLLIAANKRRELVPIEHVVTIITAAAVGLHYAHEQRDTDGKPLGIVHRDVSPSNIMVGYDGSVKLTDFGIAKAATRTTTTEGGARKGKLAYMSPEQCLGKPLDRRSDVFALGIVLYELATTRRLFKSDAEFLLMTAIVSGEIRPPSQLRPDLPPALEQIIFKALARKVSDRYQSAAELRVALDSFASEAGLRTSIPALADYMGRVFGDRPEAWRRDDPNGVELDLEVDFDGSASAIVDVNEDLRLPDSFTPLPSSPLARARAKHATGGPPIQARGGVPVEQHVAETTGTPLSWQQGSPAPRKRRAWVIGAIALTLVIAVLVIALPKEEPTHERKPGSEPSVVADPPPPPPDPAPSMPPPEPPPLAAHTDQPPSDPATPDPAVANGSGSNAAPARPTKPKKPRRRPQGWDPNALLPE